MYVSCGVFNMPRLNEYIINWNIADTSASLGELPMCLIIASIQIRSRLECCVSKLSAVRGRLQREVCALNLYLVLDQWSKLGGKQEEHIVLVEIL